MSGFRTILVMAALAGVYCSCTDTPEASAPAKDSASKPVVAPASTAPFKHGSREITAAILDSIFERKDETYTETILLTDTVADNKVMMLTAIVPKVYGCHGCGALLKGYEWSKGDQPVLQAAYYMGLHGSFGSPGPVSIRQVGPHAFAYFIEDGFTNMGITVMSRTIVLPINGKATDLLYLDDSDMTNEASGCDSIPNTCYQYTSTIDIDSTTTNALYDLRVHKKGTNQLPGKGVVSIDSLFRYRYDGVRYTQTPK